MNTFSILFVDISIHQNKRFLTNNFGLRPSLLEDFLSATAPKKSSNMIHKIDLHIIFHYCISYNHENSIVDYSRKWCKNVV